MTFEHVNIGLRIEQKLKELGMSKSEFGRKIGIPQQNVNRILSRGSIDTDKLVSISEALDFNFFDCFRPASDSAPASVPSVPSVPSEQPSDVRLLNERVKSLEALLAEKERLIKVLLDARG